jgi:hypothetical protein
MTRIPTPLPVDPGWYEAYWLTEAPPRPHHVGSTLRQLVHRLGGFLTAPRTAPHREAHVSVPACLKPTILATHLPI